MFNLFKVFNKKLSDRLLGKKASYSVSFINTELEWYELPLIKKLAKGNYPTLDHIVGIPLKSDQTKSDVILRIFVNEAGDSANQTLRNLIKNITDPQERIELATPVLEAFWIKTSDYEILKVDHVYVSQNKKDAIKIVGRRVQELKDNILEETIIVPADNYILLFDLSVMNEGEPNLQIIQSDYLKIVSSVKFSIH
jgi:hypothetical protein